MKVPEVRRVNTLSVVQMNDPDNILSLSVQIFRPTNRVYNKRKENEHSNSVYFEIYKINNSHKNNNQFS